MSSWWAIGALSAFVVGYVAAAHVPLGGRYIWQWRLFDTTQHAVLTWWPLMAAAWLLAAVLLWSTMRRLPWRIDNLGAFIAVLGLAIILVSQSWAFGNHSVGVAAVPVSASAGNTQTDALSLNYTTRYGDTHDRVLVIMVGGAAPITVAFEGLPRWNDATGEGMPKLKLHDNPKLASNIGYGTRITTKAYIADGELIEKQNNTTAPKTTPAHERDTTSLPYPANALLALEIITDLEDGGTKTTTAWLPFEPEGTDALVPKHFFPVEGLGSVGLAFRPASKKLPFALGAEAKYLKGVVGKLFVADADNDGRILQPTSYQFSITTTDTHRFAATNHDGAYLQYSARWIDLYTPADDHALVAVTSSTSNLFILAGLTTFILGVVLDRVIVLSASLRKYGNEPPAQSPTTA